VKLLASIRPKIIGLVLPGGRIQFFLQGTYSPMMGESQGRLSIRSLHNSRPPCHQCQVIVCSTTSTAKTSRPQQRRRSTKLDQLCPLQNRPSHLKVFYE